MKTSHCIEVVWSVAAAPSYQRDYLRLAPPVFCGQDLLVLDRTDLLRVTPLGEVSGRITCGRAGLWDAPVVVGPHIFLLDLVDGLHKLDAGGSQISCTKLRSSACTGILALPAGGLWVGVGATECEAVRIDDQGDVTTRRVVAWDGGLRRDLAALQMPNGEYRILVSTNAGLCCLDSQTGTLLDQPSSHPCISTALAPAGDRGSAWVVHLDDSGGCRLTCFAAIDSGKPGAKMVVRSSLPIAAELREAALFSTSDGGLWLAGTTATPDESLTASDQVLVLRVDASGVEVGRAVLPAGAAVDAAVDADDQLWVGVNSDEPPTGLSAGYLAIMGGAAKLRAHWTPPQGGVGRSCFGSAGQAVICTSDGLKCVRLRRDG